MTPLMAGQSEKRVLDSPRPLAGRASRSVGHCRGIWQELGERKAPMTAQAATLLKLQTLESLYRQGYQSDLVDRTLDKVVDLERARLRQELGDLQTRLETFEQSYDMVSAEFAKRFRAGDLGDDADFFQWSALLDIAEALRHRLKTFENDAA